VFGVANVTKMLHELPPPHREDCVNSLAYEADARFQGPVYGCVGSVPILQHQVFPVSTRTLNMVLTYLAPRHQLEVNIFAWESPLSGRKTLFPTLVAGPLVLERVAGEGGASVV